jgi:putative spermidine/putrescine transport system ATP-binding protein
MSASPLPALPLVRLRGVRKRAETDTAALHGVSLEVAAGEILTLLGPPGAGKTALLMLLAGFARADGGEILLAERLMARTPPRLRAVGLMAPGYGLFGQMNVAENLTMPLDVRGIGRAAWPALVTRALALLRLEGQGERQPGELSELERRRVMLARAVVCEPRLLLLDAPLDGLDGPAGEALSRDISRLCDRLGIGVIHATADPAEAFALADRIAVLADGRLRQVGTPRAVYDNPADAFVARIIGESNFLPGHAEDVEDDLVRVRLACGPMVEARLADARTGQGCVVAVPPERVAVAAISADEMGDGALPATLIETVYRADHIRLRLLVGLPGASLAEVMVKRPAGVPLAGLAPGEPAAIAWQPDHALAFQPESGQ